MSEIRRLRLASRGSPLARAQTDIVAASLLRVGVATEVVTVTTVGDRDQTSPVSTLTAVGAFVRAVQTAVLDGAADVAVHSAKDVPIEGPRGLGAFYPGRGEPGDALCGATPWSLGAGAVIGTGSPRRAAQLRLLLPDVVPTEIRGNVGTRLELVAGGSVAAVVLAQAGLDRLGLTGRADYLFPVDEMVPAPGQAALLLEAVAGGPAAEILGQIDDGATRTAVEAERSLLAATGAGCRAALGALVTHRPDGGLMMDAFVQDGSGSRRTRLEAADREGLVAATRRELRL